jgi:hypothetical protein
MPSININVTIRAGFVDLEGLQAVLEALGDNASSYRLEAYGKGPEGLQADLTPPQGIDREALRRSIFTNACAMVLWTRENVTTGPLTGVSDVFLRTAFIRIFEQGDEADLTDLMGSVNASCVRGAFKDAQAGMVPL